MFYVLCFVIINLCLHFISYIILYYTMLYVIVCFEESPTTKFTGTKLYDVSYTAVRLKDNGNTILAVAFIEV